MISLSFVVPCKNEERYIGNCIDSILKQTIKEKIFEIIVVDNGSTDGTLEILKNYHEKLIKKVIERVSISDLRNYGAELSNSEWIAFIDADVELDENWLHGLLLTLDELKHQKVDLTKVIVGATYSIPDNATWVQRVWYEQLKSRDKSKQNYLNGGNLIVNRYIFNDIGGFNSNFETGEDVKFCEDALSLNGAIFKDQRILAVHHGYPITIKDFFKRERWHGLGMRNFLTRPWVSRDLLLSMYYILLALVSIIVLFTIPNIFYSVGLIISGMIIPVTPLAIKRCNKKYTIVLPLAFLYMVYGYARAVSIVDLAMEYMRQKLIN